MGIEHTFNVPVWFDNPSEKECKFCKLCFKFFEGRESNHSVLLLQCWNEICIFLPLEKNNGLLALL